MYAKTRYLLDNDGRVVFATGTPVTDTVVDVCTVRRFLQEPRQIATRRPPAQGQPGTDITLAAAGGRRRAARPSRATTVLRYGPNGTSARTNVERPGAAMSAPWHAGGLRHAGHAARRLAFSLALALSHAYGAPLIAHDVVIVRPSPSLPTHVERRAEERIAGRLLHACASRPSDPGEPVDLPPDRRRPVVAVLLDGARATHPQASVDDVVCALVSLGPEAVPALVDVLSQPNDGLDTGPTAVAKRVVVRLGAPAAAALMHVLATADCDPSTRAAADLLGAASPLPSERIEELWLSHSNSCVAAAAGLVLARSADRRLLADFVTHSASTRSWIRVPAIVGLVTLHDPRGLSLAATTLTEADQDTQQRMAEALVPLLPRPDVRWLLARCARAWPRCSAFAAQALYFNSSDPVGRRLGARYADTALPASLALLFVPSSGLVRVVLMPLVAPLIIAEFIRLHLLLTIVAVALVVGEATVGRLSGGRLRIGLVASAIVGLAWGALPFHSFGRHELPVLIGAGLAAFGYTLYRLRAPITGRQAARWLGSLGVFYAGFTVGLGWLWDAFPPAAWWTSLLAAGP
jgi:hypothetical protein